ncbi:MAG: EAL domain-containing protein, partial [Ghiorsea sp.]
CKHIRAMDGFKDVPILMMTGLRDMESIQKAFESGATDFITKPVNWVLLPHRVQFLIRSNQAMHDAKINESRLKRAQKVAALGWFDWDIQNHSIQVSDEVFRIFNVEPQDEYQFFDTLMRSVHPEDQCRFKMEVQEVLHGEKVPNIEYRIQTSDQQIKTIHLRGDAAADEQGMVSVLGGTIQDISERVEAELTIRRLAYYDQVTGLPNRGLYKEHLRTALCHAKRDGHKLAVMFLDLDKFKRINDTLGHKAGDQLLSKVAAILGECVRDSDMLSRVDEHNHEVARMGGDEFTLMLTHINDHAQITLIARRIIHALTKSIALDVEREQHEVIISSSIGIAIYPDDACDVSGLLQKADVAMYRVKSQGRNNFCFFDPSMQPQGQHAMSFEAELRYAIEHDELVLFYQPKVDTLSGRVIGLEALIRWQHPQKGLISPDKFIPLAEELGLIVPLGSWVLHEACRQHQAWKKAGVPTVPIAINLSGQQFLNHCLFSEIKQVLSETGMDPYALELEITETVLMKNAEKTMLSLNQLKDVGISLAVDDFGTGYSSMSYLKHFPLDVLKIDGSFVRETPQNKQDCGIVEAVVSLAKSLGLKTIAEYVETPEQLAFLKEIGCDQIQGYLFSQPLPARDIEKKLRKGYLAFAQDSLVNM